MDKHLAVEYSGNKKWFSYEIFESLKHGQSEKVINKELEQSQELCSKNNNLNLEEENKEEMKVESSSDGSISSFSNSGEEIDSEIPQEDYASLKNEIKELRNDLKTWMEKIAAPLNLIANYIMQNQIPKPEFFSIGNNEQNIANIHEINQSEVVVHTIEDYQKVRNKYPFETFIRSELANLDSKSKKEYSRVLKIAGNIEPLAYFLFKNLSLTSKTMRSFASIWKEYFKEYRDFDLDTLKSLYIEKDFKESERKETLKKKWKQWKRICLISFGVPKDKFPQIAFTSKLESQKRVNFDITKEFIKDAWKTLKFKGKIGDALLIHLMYALKLRTGEIRLLKFEDLSDKDLFTFKVYKSQRGKVKQIQLSKTLFNEIMDFKKVLIKKEVYNKTIRQTTKSEQVAGHFMFADSESTILKKFKSNFGGILDNFNLRPKDLREASFKEKDRELSMIKEMEFTENEEKESFTIKSKKFNRDSDIVKRTQKSKKKR